MFGINAPLDCTDRSQRYSFSIISQFLIIRVCLNKECRLEGVPSTFSYLILKVCYFGLKVLYLILSLCQLLCKLLLELNGRAQALLSAEALALCFCSEWVYEGLLLGPRLSAVNISNASAFWVGKCHEPCRSEPVRQNLNLSCSKTICI